MMDESRFPQGAVASERGLTPFATLRRFASPRIVQERRERCELCCAALPSEHRHLLEVATRNIVCACDACALRFQAAAAGRFKLIPRDAHALPGFRLADPDWESLALPINLAFFFCHSLSNKMMPFTQVPLAPPNRFRIAGVDQGVRGLTPLLHFQLEVSNVPATESIHTVMLQGQIQIQSPQRIYNPQEKEKLVDQIVNAVLYEGCILYPYRPSAKKNRQRFTFGRAYPEAYSVAQNGAEPCMMQTESRSSVN
jgi:hypothetical protein